MNRVSFRVKIALMSGLVSAVVLVTFGAASWLMLKQQKLAAIDTELRALGGRHPGWLANPENFSRFSTSVEFVLGEEHRGGVIVLIKDGAGRTLFTSTNWPPAIEPERLDCRLADAARGDPSLTEEPPGRGGLGRGPGFGRGGGPVVFTKAPRFLTLGDRRANWRLGIMGNENLRLVVGVSCESVREELNQLRNAFLLVLPLALALVSGGGWLVAGRALRPLNDITKLAERVTARGLDQRISANQESPEIARLIEVLNGMMDRLEISFRQAVRFSGDASHELKTPLTIMQGEIEQALQVVPAGSPQQQALVSLLEQTQRLKSITRSLLLLAQADAGHLKLVKEPMDLGDQLSRMMEDASILAAEWELRFEVKLQPGVQVQADRSLLNMALLNLVTNAIRYNEPGGFVRLELKEVGGEIELTICNAGPGIAAADQPRLFERFYRGGARESGRESGSGLGLSLAREIVHAHQGKLKLAHSRPGETCFNVRLPGTGNQNQAD